MNPTILGVIGPGFLNQVPTLVIHNKVYSKSIPPNPAAMM